ncbi:MAG: hypothetical protein J7J96_00035 [Sulfurimonas sp.]|nr:hypothetical protein [Sulfurimonas sp.]
MTVERYLFQSPYSSSVQVGRPDPSVKKEDTSQSSSSESPSVTNQTLQDTKSFQATQISEVKSSVDSTHLLDVYA